MNACAINVSYAISSASLVKTILKSYMLLAGGDAETVKSKTAFQGIPFSLNNRMSCGLCNASVTFQRLIKGCFGELNVSTTFSSTKKKYHREIIHECK